jgi:muscarinic acetylcholine receptor
MTGMVGRAAGLGISKTQGTLLSQNKPKSIGRVMRERVVEELGHRDK